MAQGDIRTFNTAKKFSEDIIHELIKNHDIAMIKSKLGAVNSEEASKMNPQMRVLNRFNAMKDRIVFLQTLITESRPTILINGTDTQRDYIKEAKEQLIICEDEFEEQSEELLVIQEGKKPELTKKFKLLGRYLDEIYEQLQQILSKNNLIFFGDDSQFLEDEELKERIKKEVLRA